MAGETLYHRLPEDNRTSLESTGEDERLLAPGDDSHDDKPSSPKQKTFKYSFHPTLIFRFVAFALYLSAAIVFVTSNRSLSTAAAVFAFIAMGRQVWILLHYLLTRLIRVRVRIELRQSGSSITTKPKKRLPAWLLLGLVQVTIDVILAILALALGCAISDYNDWSGNGSVLGGKIVVSIAFALHILSVGDLGQPSRLTIAGKFIFDKDNDDNEGANPPQLPIYHDAVATGAGHIETQSRKTGADSPPGVI